MIYPPKSNAILVALPLSEQDRLGQHLELVTMQFRDVLCKRDEQIQHVYFPLDSVILLQSSVPHHQPVALAMISREGMTGVDLALGSDKSQFNIVVLGAGRALRMKSEVFVVEFHQSEALRQVILAYAYTFKNLIAQTGACFRFHSIEARLAHLLLAAGDYFSSDRLMMSQALLGDVLGVGRPSVCRTAAAFKARNLIDYTRGDIHITDRAGLRSLACSCYRLTERRLNTVHFSWEA